MKILVIGGISQSLVNFRGELLRSLRARGYDVTTCAGEPRAEIEETLRRWGVRFIPIHLSRAGMRPWEDLKTCWQIKKIIQEIQPDVVFSYTIKPVVWAGLVAKMVGVSTIFSLITGLGYAFGRDVGLKSRAVGLLATILYKMSLGFSKNVFFQNPDDLQYFVEKGIVEDKKCVVINGSGVNLDHYECLPLPELQFDGADKKQNKPEFIFLLIARLLWDKGIREYVAASKILQEKYPYVRFKLAGPLDTNPSSVRQRDLDRWIKDGAVEYMGELFDVRHAYADCHVYVLPSYYREGTPRTVLEAMASCRPIITTDAPGCRETVKRTVRKVTGAVEYGENGILIPVKNVDALTKAMEFFIVHPEQVEKMGAKSLLYVKERYDVHKVNAVILQTMGL